jgi:hypothetical protein
VPSPPDHAELVAFEDDDEDRTWVFDVTFLLSRWRCVYGCGCQGVAEAPAPELARGCCSFGAHYVDDDDRRRVEALADRLGPGDWQLRDVGRREGVTEVEEDGGVRTRLHDGACVLLNRPGFPGGPGCALHRAALERGARPMDWKPDVCWQLPLRRVDSTDEVGHVTSTVREWKRRDWGDGGEDFAWWCTEAPEAFTGGAPVLVEMHDELVALVGAPVVERLVAVLAARRPGTVLPHPVVRRRAGA